MERQALKLLLVPYVRSAMAEIAQYLVNQKSDRVRQAASRIRMGESEYAAFEASVRQDRLPLITDLVSGMQIAWSQALVQEGVSDRDTFEAKQLTAREIWAGLCKAILQWFSYSAGHTFCLKGVVLGAAVHAEVVDAALDTLINDTEWCNFVCAWRGDVSVSSNDSDQDESAVFQEDEESLDSGSHGGSSDGSGSVFEEASEPDQAQSIDLASEEEEVNEGGELPLAPDAIMDSSDDE